MCKIHIGFPEICILVFPINVCKINVAFRDTHAKATWIKLVNQCDVTCYYEISRKMVSGKIH